MDGARNMNKYDTMLAVNKKRNKRKIDTAKKEIYKMLENGEFFYKNEEVRALLDRAVEQQAGMVSPKRYIGNIAQKRKIELLEEQNEKLLKEMAALQEENNRLKKTLGKRALNTIKNL